MLDMTDHTAASSRQPLTGVRRVADKAFVYVAVVLVLGVLFQVYLAGVGIFGVDALTIADAKSFDDHRAWGFILAMLAVVALVLALVAREPRRILIVAAVLVALTLIAQSALAALGESNSWLGGLHALDGMAILMLSGWMAGLARQRRRAWRNEVLPQAGEVAGRDAA
jgi:hypothetical protein